MKLTYIAVCMILGMALTIIVAYVSQFGLSPSVLLYSAFVGMVFSGLAWFISIFEKINKAESPIPEVLGGLGALFVAWPLLWVLLTLGV